MTMNRVKRPQLTLRKALRNLILRSPAGLLIALFGLCMTAAAWLTVLHQSAYELGVEIERIKRENASLARAFEEHVHRILKTVDNALLFLEAEYKMHGKVTEGMARFVERAKQDPVLNQIALVNARGDLILSAVPLKRPVNIAQNETFRMHLQHPDAGLFIAKPIITQVSGTWSFFLARRLDRPDGSFNGIVTAGLDPKYFSDYFNDIELGSDRAILLVGMDGIVRARHFQGQSEVGQDLSTSPLFEKVRHEAAGNYEVVGIIDGTKRFASYRVIQEYPLIAVVSEVKDTAMASFEKRKRAYYLSASLFSLFIAGFCLLLIRAERITRRQNALLAEELEERKKTEESLKKSYSSLQSVVDSIDAVVYVADMKTYEVLLINKYAHQIFGDIQGKICWQTMQQGQTGPCSFCSNSKLVGTDGKLLDTYVWEIQNTFNGRWYECRDKAIRWTDGRIVRLEIAPDITDRKKMEEELLKTQKLESVGTLAAGIAHDFNNLLQVIIGNISLAKIFLAENSPESIAPCLEQADEASTAARELSFRLLTFSKGGEPVRKTASVESILRRSASLSLSGSNVACEFVLPPALYPVEIDEGQIIQVFNNIIINAKEAMPQGGTVRISAGNISISEDDPIPLKKGDYVKISIQDNGPGIPEEVMSKIFDPYFSTKDFGPQKGTGLGLSISLSIVRRHDGHISVESGEGTGTIFHIYIPAAKKELPGQESGTLQQKDLSKKSVLLMDDDERIRTLAKFMIEHLGYEGTYTRNGEEAIERYRHAKEEGKAFDAVILDLTVQGGMGGEKAMAKLLEADPAIKAVISSGYADDPVMKDYRNYGFADAIAKPYTMEKLQELLEKL